MNAGANSRGGSVRGDSRRGVCAAMLLCASGWAGAQVELRSGVTLEDRVVRVSLEGVEVSPSLAGGSTRVLAWDLVRGVGGDKQADAAPFLGLADSAWRARARLARGDLVLAEPALAALFDKLKDSAGPTTLRVADGLMRCRLARGEQAGALAPWLVALRLQGSDAGLPADAASTTLGAPAIDPESGLAPALPPIWLNEPAVRALATTGPQVTGLLESQDELQRLYLQAAAFDAGLAADGERPARAAPAGESGVSPGPTEPLAKSVALVRAIVESRTGDERTRRSARERLEAGLPADINTWREAWRRVAIGRSLLMEGDPATRARGVFQLLHVPARFSRTQPYLAGLATVEAAAELSVRPGDEAAAGAKRLLDELRAAEPLHPALRAQPPTGRSP